MLFFGCVGHFFCSVFVFPLPKGWLARSAAILLVMNESDFKRLHRTKHGSLQLSFQSATWEKATTKTSGVTALAPHLIRVCQTNIIHTLSSTHTPSHPLPHLHFHPFWHVLRTHAHASTHARWLRVGGTSPWIIVSTKNQLMEHTKQHTATVLFLPNCASPAPIDTAPRFDSTQTHPPTFWLPQPLPNHCPPTAQSLPNNCPTSSQPLPNSLSLPSQAPPCR